MRTSEQTNEVFTALAKAQGELDNPNKSKTAKVRGTTKDGRAYEMTYKYADIADVLSNARPILAKNGLAVLQPTMVYEGAMFIVTRLAHASGQWIESEYPVAQINADHQKMGAALTYARRYALCSLIGIAAEEDVDGQDAADPAPFQRPKTATKSPAQAKRDGDWEALTAEIDEQDTVDALEAWAGANRPRIEALPGHWKQELRDYYAKHKAVLDAREIDAEIQRLERERA